VLYESGRIVDGVPKFFHENRVVIVSLAFCCHRLCCIFIKMSRKCVTSPDKVCYFCGEVTFASRKCSIAPTIKKTHFLYFGFKVGEQEKKWAPHVCCTACSSKLNAWVTGKGRCMPFGVPMVWRVPSNHSTDSYLCMVHRIQNGMSMKKKSTLVYPNIPSTIRPVLHGDELPVPEPPDNFAMYSDDYDSVSSNSEEKQPSASRDADYLTSTDSSNHKITEGELNDLIRDLQLPKNKAELLAKFTAVEFTTPLCESDNISHQKPRIRAIL